VAAWLRARHSGLPKQVAALIRDVVNGRRRMTGLRVVGVALAVGVGAILGCALITLIVRWFR
jgi:predicted phosphoribosyltransferase